MDGWALHIHTRSPDTCTLASITPTAAAITYQGSDLGTGTFIPFKNSPPLSTAHSPTFYSDSQHPTQPLSSSAI